VVARMCLIEHLNCKGSPGRVVKSQAESGEVGRFSAWLTLGTTCCLTPLLRQV
jgi:hypothetical protein